MKPRTALLTLVIAFSCSGGNNAPPAGVLPPDRFADLYADLLRQEAQLLAAPADTLAARRGVDSLLRACSTTREEVRASVAWYNQDVVRWRFIMDTATTRLERGQPARW